MPGRRLNDDERRLLGIWRGPPVNLSYLKSIEVSGGTGLRGIDGLIVPFRYPLTAICGNNGVGKSTVLALATLAYHSPAGWFVHWGNTGHQRSQGDRSYYTFLDFFVRGQAEAIVNGVSITWRYFGNEGERSLAFTKSRGWGRYVNRPEREVDFLSLGRILPAHEVRGVRSAFSNQQGQLQTNLLDERNRQFLSYIIGKEYARAEVQQNGRYSFQNCHADAAYTGFNMGCGESCIIALLYLLQRMSRGGLLVIEEIESGLHPQAQIRLAEVLIKIALQKQIQIICSTHSETFLDALPRQARLVLKKLADGHSVIEAPSTRFAKYEMTGEAQPEVIIYCEDEAAAFLVEEALPQNLRLRVKVQAVGSDATVIRQGISHIRSGFEMQSLCVLDGDATHPDIKGWITSERGHLHDITPRYILLPGDNFPPERWVAEQLRIIEYRRAFANQFSCSLADAQRYAEALHVDLDHHDLGYVLNRLTNLGKSDCLRRTMRAVAPRHPQLDELREVVREMLS